MLRRSAAVFAVILVMAAIIMAQGIWEKKPYPDWSKDEVTTVLEKSPWACAFNKSLEKIGHLRSTGETISGTEMAYDKLSFRFSLVTAKPVRMALARRAILADPANAGKTDWGKYIDQEDDKNIILIMTFSASPAGSNTDLIISDLLGSLKTADLASKTYLGTDGGKKVGLAQYDPLGESGYGFRFIFPRNLPDGSPLVAPNNKEIRFETTLSLPQNKGIELPKTLLITGKWDLKKMVYQGKLIF
ncbi:MAG: hypothetical protein LAP85_19860 [Acidobacteriia bacterium]|nr:hypothetical protein [Terriglobia bacterium]